VKTRSELKSASSHGCTEDRYPSVNTRLSGGNAPGSCSLVTPRSVRPGGAELRSIRD
jgi:hypothetical protein